MSPELRHNLGPISGPLAGDGAEEEARRMTSLIHTSYTQEVAVRDEAGAIFAALRSLLRSWLDHTRHSLLDLYDLSPRTVTLAQLAPLYVQHSGSRGQSFEWSVHEAINDPRRTEVRDLVAGAMSACGLRTRDPHSTLFAQERFANAEFMEALVSALGGDARLRLYRRPGRPHNLRPLVDEIKAKGIHSMNGPLSMLPRADLLLNDGDVPSFIAASCKHNPADVEDWPGVPIWITAESYTRSTREALTVDHERGQAVVTLPVDGRFIHCFELAETILLRVTLELCRRSTRGLAPSTLVASQIARRLGQRAHAPVIEISDWCDTEAQPGLIAVGVNDSVQVAAPSWLTSVRRRLHSLFSPPVTDTFVDFPRALPA